MNEKKKSPFIIRLFKGILIFFCIILVSLFGWIGFSALDRMSPLDVIPSDYSVFVHTDSVWDAVSPIIDLKAADVLLADPLLSNYRAPFMEFRSSALRGNKYLRFAASRSVYAAFYAGKGISSYIALIDMSFLSALTRLAPLVAPHLNINNLEYVKDYDFPYFKYSAEKNSAYYIAQKRNLVVASDSLSSLSRAISDDNAHAYKKEEKAVLLQKTNDPIRIIANGKRLAEQFTAGNDVTEALSSLLDETALSVVSFGITDADITVKAEFPFAISDTSVSPLAPLLIKNSKMPALLSQLGESVQYYTLLNAGQFTELKDALFPLLQKTSDIERTWQRANAWCKRLFSVSLDDIVFSWTGSECAVLGIEGNTDPVFVLQIRDARQREKIFDSIFSSFAIENNTNLIIGGVRLPRIDMPLLLRELLASFGVDLPRPYYFVQGDYIYFSESPQNLSTVYNDLKERKMLARNENWKTVSGNQSAEATMSVYYDLKRSVPFFIRNGTLLADVLKLYTVGRCDFRLKNSVLTCQLHAVASSVSDMRLVPGFPIAIEGATDFLLHAEAGKNPGAVFWLENGKKIRSLELSSMKKTELGFTETASIVPAAEKCREGGVLWAVGANGAVHLLNRALENVGNFPILTGAAPSARPAAFGKTLLIPSRGSVIIVVKDDGTYDEVRFPDDGEILSAPSLSGDTAAVYEKSFAGSIYLMKNQKIINASEPMEIEGIGFDSPALLQTGGFLYTAFITQSGRFYLFKDGKLEDGFPIETNGVFYTNVVSCGSFFFALSEDADVYRFALDGTFTTVKIPGASSARQGKIASVRSASGDAMYVCADENVLYGFMQSLELVPGFPVAGRGVPVIADVNGDKKDECIVLSFDKNLYAWDIR